MSSVRVHEAKYMTTLVRETEEGPTTPMADVKTTGSKIIVNEIQKREQPTYNSTTLKFLIYAYLLGLIEKSCIYNRYVNQICFPQSLVYAIFIVCISYVLYTKVTFDPFLLLFSQKL